MVHNLPYFLILTKLITKVARAESSATSLAKARAAVLDIALSFAPSPLLLYLKKKGSGCLLVEEGAPGVFCSVVYASTFSNSLLAKVLKPIMILYVSFLRKELNGREILLNASHEILVQRWSRRRRGEDTHYHLVRLTACQLWSKRMDGFVFESQKLEDLCQVVRAVRSWASEL